MQILGSPLTLIIRVHKHIVKMFYCLSVQYSEEILVICNA